MEQEKANPMTLENSSTGKQILGTVLLFSFVMFCIQKVLSGKNIVEGFGQFQRRARVDTVNPQTGYSRPGNNQLAMAPPTLTVPGQFHSPLSPRFNSTGLGPNITYNVPALEHLANDPANPLMIPGGVSPSQYAGLVETNVLKEVPSSGGVNIKENFNYGEGNSSSEYQKLVRDNKMDGTVVDASLALPVGTMTASSAAGGGSKVPLVMDRFIVAPLKSRLFQHADFIRGDIAIVPVNPNANPNSCTWFRPSVNPSVDLNPGALAVMGGAYGEQARSVAQLQQQASGGAVNTAAGVAWEISPGTTIGQQMVDQASMVAQKMSIASNGSPYGDVNVYSPSSLANIRNDIQQQSAILAFP